MSCSPAVAQLASHADQRIRVTIIGGGANHDTYRALAGRLGLGSSVELTGHISDPVEVRARLQACGSLRAPVAERKAAEGAGRSDGPRLFHALPRRWAAFRNSYHKHALYRPETPRPLPRPSGLCCRIREEMNRRSRENLAAAHRIAERVRDADLVSFVGGGPDALGGGSR